MIRVMLLDDHPVVRAGLRAIINAFPDMTVVAEGADIVMVKPALAYLDGVAAVLDDLKRAGEALEEARPKMAAGAPSQVTSAS